MLFKEFLSEIESSMPQHKAANLLDDLMVYNFMIEGLKELSILPTIRIQRVVNIKNNKGKLPDGFKSLYSAVKCEPYVFTPEIDEPQDVLQDIYTYKVREIKNANWNICNPCDVTEEETCIVEKTYLHNGLKGNFYYNNITPLRLKLTPYVKKNQCDTECKNFQVKDSPYEISINNKMLYTNFKDGNVFITYNGYDEDEEGFLMIPESTEDNLLKYLKAYVQREIIKNLFTSGLATKQDEFLYSLYATDASNYFAKAMGEYKMKKVLYSLRYTYPKEIRKEFEIYNKGKSNVNKIEFLVI